MKLLGWMHRKFRQHGNESLKDFSVGNPCTCLTGKPSLDGQQYFSKQNCGIRNLMQAQKEPALKSFPGLPGAPGREDYHEEKSYSVLSDHFDGFLSIGTLGSDPTVPDPPTPTFPISVDNVTEVTENELKLINDELEFFLGAEAKEDSCSLSSGRNSLVSAGRSSHGSTITLSGKPIEASDANGNETAIFPLQGYLFGSAIDLPETTSVVKKENRTSLGELFQKTKISEENSGDMSEKEEKRANKNDEKSAVHLMKKMLKKKMLNVSSKNSNTAAVSTPDSALTESKLHKILHLFQRKVHPLSSTAAKKHSKPQKNKKYNCVKGRRNNEDQNQILPGENTMIFSQRELSRGSLGPYRSQCNASLVELNGTDSNGNREYWIKTDADYLVLEL